MWRTKPNLIGCRHVEGFATLSNVSPRIFLRPHGTRRGVTATCAMSHIIYNSMIFSGLRYRLSSIRSGVIDAVCGLSGYHSRGNVASYHPLSFRVPNQLGSRRQRIR